jgi:acetyl-CoA carboxylase carboxyl transferase alpha subunit/acetyl-CoA carboxylase carboxyl transferase beta subunit
LLDINKHLQKFSTLLKVPYDKFAAQANTKKLSNSEKRKSEEKKSEESDKKIVGIIKDKIEKKIEEKIEKNDNGEILIKCKQCSESITVNTFNANNSVCPKCNAHYKITSKDRIELIFDRSTIVYFDENLKSSDPLTFPKYSEKLKETTEKLGINEAVITGKASIDNSAVYFGIMDYRFIMASMGTVVGEKIVRLFEASIKDRVPVIIFCASGGARMQEGILSLYQMARVSAVIKKHSNEGLLYISVLTDPTYGGVTASFASLGDIIIAEKGANIGFAGKRIIENVVKQKLPKEFQTAEFMLKHGLVDYVVERKNLKSTLSNIIKIHNMNAEEVLKDNVSFEMFRDIAVGKSDTALKKEEVTAWDKVLLARNKQRPNFKDYIDGMIDNFVEFHGDRYVGDDPAIVGGIGYLKGIPVTVIFNAKGKDMNESMKRNFGMAHPEGYKKALRLMKQAEKFKRPVLCFVDTPGAFCGVQAEERGQGIAIAECLKELIELKVPVITVITGEGGSGGALAFSVSDWTFMLENSIYSIISPESCAEIIFKDHTKAKEVAEHMKLTSLDLLELNIVDEIIEEPEGGAHNNAALLIESVKNKVFGRLVTLLLKNNSKILEERFSKIMSKGKI